MASTTKSPCASKRPTTMARAFFGPFSPFRPSKPLLAAAIALWSGIAPAAEPTHYDYALDEQTELTLEPKVGAPKTWAMDLRRYGSAEQGLVLRCMGDLEQASPGVYLYERLDKSDGTNESVRVMGKLGVGQPLEIVGLRLRTYAGGETRIEGKFTALGPAQRLARAKQRWEKADVVLNQVYTRVKAEVGKAGEAKLREIQRGQLDRRDRHSLSEGHGEKNNPDYWDAMLNFTTSNISFLKIYTGRDVPKGLTGTYTDGVGGSLELEETTKGLKFSMSAVRKISLANGEIGGVARLKGNRATFKAELSKEEAAAGQKPAELTFTVNGHIVHVDAKNTGDYGGSGVYFDGDYYKEGKLKKSLD